MVYITRKKIKGKVYLYLEESGRVNGKRKRLWQKYLGPEDRLKDKKFDSLLSKHENDVEYQIQEFGISAALSVIAEKIRLAETIDKNTEKKREQGLSVGEYITLAAINRCAAPCSKSKLSSWFAQDWISTRYDVDPAILNAQTYWNHFQYLSPEIMGKIEAELNKIVIKEFDLNIDSLFFDPTNFFTFSKGTGKKGLLQFGHSKENRNGNRLVSYSLLCARESGVPIMHHTYPGNTQDAGKFKEIPEMISNRLKTLGHNTESITLVFDKGNHSREAFNAIDDSGYGFIVSARNSTQKKLLTGAEDKFVQTTLPHSNKVVKYLKTSKTIYGKKRDVFVVLDPRKKKKATVAFEEKLQEKVDAVHEFFKDRLNVKKWRRKEAVDRKITSMIGKNPFKRAIVYEITGEDEHLVLNVHTDEVEVLKHIETLGKSVLFTNKFGWTPESIIWGYREQYIVEHAFKRMKSPTSIAVRPMYHRSNRSIRAHVFICVISLLLLSLLRLTLSRNSVSLSYEEILDALKRVHALGIKATPTGDTLWKVDTIKGNAKRIVKKLKLTDLL